MPRYDQRTTTNGERTTTNDQRTTRSVTARRVFRDHHGDGEADARHVDGDAPRQCRGGERIRDLVGRDGGERQDDEAHEEIDGDAVERADDPGVRGQRIEDAAGEG